MRIVGKITHDDMLDDTYHLTKGIGTVQAQAVYTDAAFQMKKALIPPRNPSLSECSDERDNGVAAGEWDDEVQQYQAAPGQFAPESN